MATTPSDDKGSVRQAFMGDHGTPAQSSSPWDVYDLVATVPGEEAFPDGK